MKKLILCMLLTGCAGSRTCPDESVEAVSVCRAEAACGRGTARNFFATLLGGMGSGMSGQRNGAVDVYDQCVDRNLRAQKLNAGIPDNSVRCKSRRVASDEFETTCD